MHLLPYAILDMDGTLLDSTGMWDLVADEVLGHWGMTFPRADRRDNMTLTIDGTAMYYVQHYGLPTDPATVAQMIRDAALHGYAAHATLKPGAVEALDAMQARGTKMCLASGTEKPLVDAALAKLGILDRFAFTLACETPQGKAGPEVYLRALQGLGAAAPGQVMVFEDSPTAVETAKTAGFYTVGVYDSFTAEDWPRIEATADALVPSWPQWTAKLS